MAKPNPKSSFYNEGMKENLIKEMVEDKEPGEQESFVVGMLLALSIGILNACTWMTRGHVFASSQAGNLLYLGLDLAQGKFNQIEKYLFPPLMFGIGIIVAEHFHDKPHYSTWRRIPMIIEMVMITIATFLPDSWNALANPIFGLACGLQAITFRRIHQVPIATTAINGSFQNALEHLTRYINIHEHEDAFRAILYATVVLDYLVGIIIGGLLVPLMGHKVSLVSVAAIGISALIIKEKAKENENTQK